jgi:hypothetical protein
MTFEESLRVRCIECARIAYVCCSLGAETERGFICVSCIKMMGIQNMEAKRCVQDDSATA